MMGSERRTITRGAHRTLEQRTIVLLYCIERILNTAHNMPTETSNLCERKDVPYTYDS